MVRYEVKERPSRQEILPPISHGREVGDERHVRVHLDLSHRQLPAARESVQFGPLKVVGGVSVLVVGTIALVILVSESANRRAWEFLRHFTGGEKASPKPIVPPKVTIDVRHAVIVGEGAVVFGNVNSGQGQATGSSARSGSRPADSRPVETNQKPPVASPALPKAQQSDQRKPVPKRQASARMPDTTCVRLIRETHRLPVRVSLIGRSESPIVWPIRAEAVGEGLGVCFPLGDVASLEKVTICEMANEHSCRTLWADALRPGAGDTHTLCLMGRAQCEANRDARRHAGLQ